MPADEITQRHLNRLRIRGAPSTIPGSGASVGLYDAEETWRQTARALVAPLDKHVTATGLEEAFTRLASVAAAQKLTDRGRPTLALKGDPTEDPPHKWEYGGGPAHPAAPPRPRTAWPSPGCRAGCTSSP